MMKTNPTTMKRPEARPYDLHRLKRLQQLIDNGEGIQLEFKRKTNFPEKIIREIVAFANTHGGKLLVGVSDDHEIAGVKFPDEDSYLIREALQKHCRPSIDYAEEQIPVGSGKYVLLLDIPSSDKKPHYLVTGERRKESFVRVADKSIQASREVAEILRRRRRQKDVHFRYGEHERLLLQHLANHENITLKDYATLSGLNRYRASRKLILLVLANVLKVTPTERGDLYSLVPVVH